MEQTEVAAKEPESKAQLPKDVMLRLENLNLKMQNVHLQLQMMNAQLQQAVEVRNKLQVEMDKVRAEIQAEYGVDIATAKITPEGVVSP